MTPENQEEIYDVIGIGFGPSNLALAIALHEHNQSVPDTQQLTYRFIERQPAFSWHRGMLLDSARMQISFLKDLATPRNPTSEFSFISYLHQCGRLAAFTNHKTLFPLRLEFHDYLEWASKRFGHHVTYGHEVLSVRPVKSSGNVSSPIEEMKVAAKQPGASPEVSWRARNIVLAIGLSPSMPDGITESERVWHSESFLDRLNALPLRDEPKFVVVGAGQSAAEITEYLLSNFSRCRVHAVMSRYGYSLSDNSPFVNEIYDAAAVESFFKCSAELKSSLLDYHGNTNYSVVDQDLIEHLYHRHYQELVAGELRLHLRRMSRVAKLNPSPASVNVAIERLATGTIEEVDVDAVIFASGYQPADTFKILAKIVDECRKGTRGLPQISVDYRLEMKTGIECRVYLVGPAEDSHGLSSSLLSNIAVRAGQVVESVIKLRQ